MCYTQRAYKRPLPHTHTQSHTSHRIQTTNIRTLTSKRANSTNALANMLSGEHVEDVAAGVVCVCVASIPSNPGRVGFQLEDNCCVQEKHRQKNKLNTLQCLTYEQYLMTPSFPNERIIHEILQIRFSNDARKPDDKNTTTHPPTKCQCTLNINALTSHHSFSLGRIKKHSS